MRVLVIPLLLVLSVAPVLPGQAASFTVTNTKDGGSGSLRQAIVQSNANGAADTITFAGALSGKMIQPRRPLPVLSEGRLTINGDLDGDGAPDIILSGAVCGGTGIDIQSRENTVRGLAIRHFDKGIAIFGPGAVQNQVAGCYIGTNLTGTWALGNDHGVYVSGAAQYNTIGGTTATDRNVLSGNIGAGVAIVAADSNRVFGNFIGLNRTGTRMLPNSVGVLISDCEKCRVGNGAENGRNIISGNRYQEAFDAVLAASSDLACQGPGGPVGGVYVFRGANHRIAGNYIGTDVTGSLPRGNRQTGIAVVNSVGLAIGGTTPGARNVISANGEGVNLVSCHGAALRGNYIGLNALGNRLLGAQGSLLALDWCSDTLVGGTTAGARNVVAGGRWTGIRVNGGYDNSILGNYVGLNAAGTRPLGSYYGIAVGEGAYNTWIGNTQSGSGNVIAAVDQDGIKVEGYDTEDTRIMRNSIGTDAAGSRHFPCRQHGIWVSSDAGTVTIGGNTKARGNKIVVMSGRDAIDIDARYAGDSTVRHNTILGPSGATLGSSGIQIGESYSHYWEFGGRVADNTIRRFGVGVFVGGSAVHPIVAGNRFSTCTVAISIQNDAYPNLGDLSSAPTNDDGGNVFGTLSSYAVQNWSSKDIKAEGNDWGTISAAAIDGTLIYDQLDQPSYGRVDYDPLIGNVPPGPMPPPSPRVTGVAAVPTAAGAEIAFTLSAPAEVGVQVLNIAGRPVARVRPRTADAGLSRLTWNGMSATGTRVPGGVYLVRVTARTASGEQTSALATLQLGR
jgi:nitrous oxidase accessory protein NosD